MGRSATNPNVKRTEQMAESQTKIKLIHVSHVKSNMTMLPMPPMKKYSDHAQQAEAPHAASPQQFPGASVDSTLSKHVLESLNLNDVQIVEIVQSIGSAWQNEGQLNSEKPIGGLRKSLRFLKTVIRIIDD